MPFRDETEWDTSIKPGNSAHNSIINYKMSNIECLGILSVYNISISIYISTAVLSDYG